MNTDLDGLPGTEELDGTESTREEFRWVLYYRLTDKGLVSVPYFVGRLIRDLRTFRVVALRPYWRTGTKSFCLLNDDEMREHFGQHFLNRCVLAETTRRVRTEFHEAAREVVTDIKRRCKNVVAFTDALGRASALSLRS